MRPVVPQGGQRRARDLAPRGAVLLGVGALAYAAAVGLIAVAAVVAADARREAGRDDGE